MANEDMTWNYTALWRPQTVFRPRPKGAWCAGGAFNAVISIEVGTLKFQQQRPVGVLVLAASNATFSSLSRN
jgi:hypothetical protein